MRRPVSAAFWAVVSLGLIRGLAAQMMTSSLDVRVWLPPVVSPGDAIRFSFDASSTRERLERKKEQRSTAAVWYLEGKRALPAEGKYAWSVQLPENLPTSIETLDLTSVISGNEERRPIRVLPRPPTSSRPQFDRCGPQVTTQPVICLCGWFPGEASRRGLLIDGKPAGLPLASSSRSVCLRLTEGSHRISGSPLAGFDQRTNVTVDVVKIHKDAPGKVLVGDPFTIIWIVVGTSRPVRLQLRNLTPGIARLEGGDEQIESTSGGQNNSISRIVTMTSNGQSQIKAELLDEDSPFYSKAYLAMLEEVFQAKLRDISDKFSQSLRELSEDHDLDSEIAGKLLEETRAEIQESLRYPELAAFRVLVDDLFDVALKATAANDSGLRPAALQSRQESSSEEKNNVEIWLQRIAKFFEWAKKQKLARQLFVRTTPVPGASFEIQPKTYSSYKRSTPTDYAICNIPLGRYNYTVKREGFQAIRGFTIDLLQDDRQVFECSLQEQGHDAIPCGFRPGVAEDCK